MSCICNKVLHRYPASSSLSVADKRRLLQYPQTSELDNFFCKFLRLYFCTFRRCYSIDVQEVKESDDPRYGVNWISVASLKVATYKVGVDTKINLQLD